jgi:hypothetical protein
MGHWLAKHVLPDVMFGYDTDEVFAYTTPKVAWVRDRYVGFGYYCLLLLAMCWVIFGQIFWRNEHFQLKDVRGIARMWVSHPTVNQCDPNVPGCKAEYKPVSSLPYCVENVNTQVLHPAKCKYGDKFSILPDGINTNRMFIPTAEIVMTEKRSCKPSSENEYKCDALYVKEGMSDDVYYMNETMVNYYANVEDYIIQFTSTYHRDAISGTSLKHPGSYWECQDKRKEGDRTWNERLHTPPRHDDCEDMVLKEIDCLKGLPGCKKDELKKMGLDDLVLMDESNYAEYTSGRRLRAANKLSAQFASASAVDDLKSMEEPYRPTPEVYASIWGDTFKLGKLLELADADLDHHYNMDNLTTRMAGTIIEVEVVYENMRKFLSSFGLSQVRYAYKVVEKKLPYISREWLATVQPADYPETRRYVVQHGVLVVFNISGEFGFFSIVYLLIMLTTATALLGAAHKITDLFSIYGHPRKKNYFQLKYEVSPDFSEMWECTKCGYYNQPSDTTCKGLEQWTSGYDVDVCGAAKPGTEAPA